ncbi:hypothetical protein GDO86_009036 [Hymenochirus boettgeri]|uniref:Uncharacterized protein n=1 Tax=Hymenochirus boettgeri TaxID=247094 RepID=A0A8T2JJ56_9PIPI|nr:hypothetical protein GDO86_009036 [Hymenochirus boettgeri]
MLYYYPVDGEVNICPCLHKSIWNSMRASAKFSKCSCVRDVPVCTSPNYICNVTFSRWSHATNINQSDHGSHFIPGPDNLNICGPYTRSSLATDCILPIKEHHINLPETVQVSVSLQDCWGN